MRSPRWTAEALEGRKLLVYADKPLAPVRELVPSLRRLSERRCRVVIVCGADAGAELATDAGIGRVVPLGDPLPEHDLYVPLLSLPWLLARGAQSRNLNAEERRVLR